jgi:hypothetical protein
MPLRIRRVVGVDTGTIEKFSSHASEDYQLLGKRNQYC